MKRIGIVGSREYKNNDKVVRVIEEAINKFGQENVCVVSGGAKGADLLGKQVALIMDVMYEEYNPSHTPHNIYSVKPKEFFGKEYNPGNFFERNTSIAEACDYIVGFIPKGVKAAGTMDTVNKAKKLNKPVWIME